MEKLSERWNGDIWVKRDDLTGSGLSGNKVRKLEYLVADARSRGADTLISCGGIQSNHCRATSIAAAQLGLSCRLLLRGEAPQDVDGNLLLDRMAGAEVEFISEEKYAANVDAELQRIADDVISNGKVPYIIPEGGSNPVGAWGYVNAAFELKKQCSEIGISPKRLVCATGSGGTHAGLWLGVKLAGWDVEVISMTVCYSASETTERIFRLVESAIEVYDLSIKCRIDDILVNDSYLGDGYALAGEDVFRTMIEAASTEGILVDPVYTGKTLYGIKEETLAGRFAGLTVFVHTGGVFGIFPHRSGLNRFLD